MKRPQLPESRRKSSTIHYQTFPTPPPKSKGQPPSQSPSSSRGSHHGRHGSSSSGHTASPLPKRQLAILAVIALCEQTALNSISPYLPQMASSFPEVDAGQVGLYVGTIASSFALAQFATNFFWGWISDRIGRKPVVLTGTLFTALGLLAFGFCRKLWQAVLVQVFIGLSNGNQGVISTCLGEITDRSNQSRAFVYLPVLYGLGGITGPVLGGLLVPKGAHPTKKHPYPYLPPNLLSTGILVLDLILSMIFLEESLEEARDLPPLGKRVADLFSWVWQFASSSRPTYLKVPDRPQSHMNGDRANERDDEEISGSETGSQASLPTLLPHQSADLAATNVFGRDTICLLTSFLIFQLSNVSYNSLYPIFGAADPPTGRSLSPEEIGITLGFAGAATIIFQVGVFGKLREKMGNRKTYCVCMAGMVVAYLLTPWVGYKDAKRGDGGISSGQRWLWVRVDFDQPVKTNKYTQITNSAPNHAVLGRINGLAQTLSAAGRAVGPFIAGSLFSLATHVHPKGEAMAFGVFGGITFLGFLLTFGIRGKGLEAAEWDEEEGSEDDEDEHSGEDTRR
ncbi:MAG: hypothetical protein Q9191_006879 [Dirinaria sp. TL-2023a]